VLCSVMPTGHNTDRVESVNDSASHRSAHKAMAVTICLLLLTLGLMKPVLRSHHFNPLYRRASSSREAALHTPLDVSGQAPDIRTVELGRDVARHLLVALDASHHLAHPLPLEVELFDAPPGVFLHRRLAPAHAGDPDPLS
jgi:hypothetical protein